MRKVLTKIFGDPNEASLKPFQSVIDEVNELEPEMEALTDDALQQVAVELRDRLSDNEALDDLLPESFAMTREMSRRVLGQRHYDV
jgi:preprotein translocase subunit SecA